MPLTCDKNSDMPMIVFLLTPKYFVTDLGCGGSYHIVIDKQLRGNEI